ncbi:MAG TPA: P-loop NTPase fold protein, partial [Longimicrobiaceae bacterium]|nr:P-loop NTPase fold protein [Longimicrobiaceae bacterium]
MEPISQTQQVNLEGLEFATPRRPDIFISYASDAGKWADRVSSLLLRPGSQVDSAPVDAAGVTDADRRARARRGYAGLVVLITQGYVSSAEAQRELSAFVEDGVPLVPAYGIEVGHDFGILRIPDGFAMHLFPRDGTDLLGHEDADAVLAEICAEIRSDVDHRLAAETSTWAEEKQESGAATVDPLLELVSQYQIYDSVADVLGHAAGYAAAATPPALLSTSLVLLTFAEHGSRQGAPTWAGDWMRVRLGDAFEGLRSRYFAEKRIPGEARPDGRVGGLRKGIALTLNRARDLARRTTGTDEIRARHLLAALLTDSRPEAGALKQLARAKLDVATLKVELYDFVRAYGDDDEAWGHILLGSVAEDARLSGFNADDSRSDDDYLDIRSDVEAFGKLIAARTVNPPLSIGLFGEWGSGKTFFMRMLQGEVNRLAQLADGSKRMQRDLPYWKRIIQIEFNAWHYVEGNLWASLVQHIFDNLRFAGETDRGVIKELQNHLVSQIHKEKAAETQAIRERTEAQALVKAAGDDVETARTAFETQAGELAKLSARNFLSDIPLENVRSAADGTLKTLGLTEVGNSAVELRAALEEARSLLNRGRSVAAPLLYGEDRQRRLAYLFLALLAGPLMAVGTGWLLTWLGQAGIAGIGAASGGVAGALSTAAAWVRAQLSRADEWIRQIEKAQRELDEKVARAQADSLEAVRAAEEKLRLYEADYQAAKRKEAEAQRRVADAELRLKEASVTELLTDFVETRANSTDYRKHLGTLALVRNDFQRLSEIIDAENWRLSPGADEEGRPSRFATLDKEQADRAKRINRIVLYIDDLDRCPPAKVVEVLQAVHLLLAFPLFVVVVGVDARWVVRSVETRYRELLRAGQGADERAMENNEFLELFGAATAHDYLEKIFQVPFWLRTMTDRACQKMVRGLLASSMSPEAGDTGAPPPQLSRGLAGNVSQDAPARAVDPATR